MHIIHINTEKGYSGGEEQMFMLMKELRGMGVSNELIGAKGSTSIRTAKELGFDVFEARMRNNWDWPSILAGRSWL